MPPSNAYARTGPTRATSHSRDQRATKRPGRAETHQSDSRLTPTHHGGRPLPLGDSEDTSHETDVYAGSRALVEDRYRRIAEAPQDERFARLLGAAEVIVAELLQPEEARSPLWQRRAQRWLEAARAAENG